MFDIGTFLSNFVYADRRAKRNSVGGYLFLFRGFVFFFNNINENYLLAMNFIQCVWIVLVYPKSFSIFLAPVIKLRSQYPYFIFTALHFSYNV